MATQAAEAVGFRSGAGSFATFADRWIYVFTAALFFATVLIGFLPDSANMLNAVSVGERPPLPGFMHFHAVLMGTWISLLLVQSTLMATGKRGWHMQLGIAAVALAPAIIASMVGVVAADFTMIATLPPEAASAPDVVTTKFVLSNLILEQSRIVILFPVFVTWALLVRKTDSEAHKRLLILATVLPLPAAIDRMTFLPTSMPDSPLTVHLYQLLWLAPVLIYDLWRRGRLHRVYVIGIALNLPFIAYSYLRWGTDSWLEAAPKLFGIQSW
jgi:hypothetical protein